MEALIYRVANMINYGLSRNEAVSALISEGTSPEKAWMIAVAAQILIDKMVPFRDRCIVEKC